MRNASSFSFQCYPYGCLNRMISAGHFDNVCTDTHHRVEKELIACIYIVYGNKHKIF